MQRRISVLGLPILLFALASAAFAQRPSLPTPEQFLGFRVGASRKLARWDQVLEYMQRVSGSSPRVRYEELGKSTLGHAFPMLTISSPRNLDRLKEIQAAQKQLAYPYKLGDVQADELIRKNPLVVLVTCTIHSNEIGSTQMCLELVHELATDNSPRVREILDNVVFLLVPSANPDGQVLVVDWYQKNVGTPYEHAPLPFLYHPYTGHDDNRDAYMLTQIETRLITRVLYRDWFPMVYLDEHQMGSSGARIFVPPFADPVNPNQDPLVIAATSQIGMQLFTALNAAGLEGAKYGEDFTWWWQGSAKNGAWYHNMFGLLSEVASSRLASPIEQRRAEPGRTPTDAEASSETSAADPRRPLPAPRDLWSRANYPKPWRGGTWTLRNIVDYELVITRALLEHCAQQRETYQRYFHRLNRKAIAAGRKGEPAAYVLPADQRDPGAAARLLDVLDQAGIEIYQARAPFSADGVSYEAGSWVIPMAQPFRNYAKDLLEPQDYPMRPARPGQSPERPYDVTGWTLPLQMGVRAIEIKTPFSAPMTRVQPIPPPEGKLTGEGTAAYLVPRAWNSAATLVNRLLAGNPRAAWEAAAADEAFTAAGRDWPAGTLVLTPRTPGPAAADELARVAHEVHVAPTALAEAPRRAEDPSLPAPPRAVPALHRQHGRRLDTLAAGAVRVPLHHRAER